MTGKQPKVPQQVTFERVQTEYYPERVGFRPNTVCFPLSMNFVFLNGGNGDYITWMTPIRWLASEATWITGTLIVPVYFKELAEYWLKPYPKWKVKSYTELNDIPKVDETPFRGPMVLQQESLNATGAHLLTCGWVYFTNKEGPPPGWENYSEFNQADLDNVVLPGKVPDPGKYVVMSLGTTTNSRTIPGKYWNYVIDHILSKGLVPVFLGKESTETGNARNIHTTYDKTLKLDAGVNLINQTSLMQAAAIMSRAKLVVGHDNGLLHLAGCTTTPIVFGYNLASPEHRKPRRTVGKVYDVHLQPGELACNFCQSRTNFVIGFNFRECFYKDLACIPMLFNNDGQRWKDQIDLALEESV